MTVPPDASRMCYSMVPRAPCILGCDLPGIIRLSGARRALADIINVKSRVQHHWRHVVDIFTFLEYSICDDE